MKTYQLLALIGGIFGIVLVPIITLIFGLALSKDPQSVWVGITVFSIMASIIFSVVAILIAFLLESQRNAGVVLLICAISLIIITNVSGVPAWALLLAGGISVFRDINAEKRSPGISILKKRYARGEITKDEFDIMRKNLE